VKDRRDTPRAQSGVDDPLLHKAALAQNGDRDRDGNWQHGQNTGGWNNNNDVAYRTGYQDGLNEGRKDRSGGHSFRPHSHDETYGNADHNYSTVGGDRTAYKQRYRQAFDQGYNKGYNGR